MVHVFDLNQKITEIVLALSFLGKALISLLLALMGYMNALVLTFHLHSLPLPFLLGEKQT